MNDKKWRVSKTAIKQYFLLVVFMMIHGNRVLTLYNDYILIGVLLIGLATIVTRISVFGEKNILFLGVLTVCMFMVFVYTSGSLMISTILMLLSRFVIAFVAFGIDRENFVARFVRLVYLLACVSLVGLVITQTVPEILTSFLPKYVYYYISPWSGQAVARPTYYALIFQFRADGDISRNIGMFNEPGLYQIVLNTAIYFLLFHKNKCFFSDRKYKRYLMVLVVTLITAQSATGLIGFSIICMGYVFAENKEYKWKTLLAFIFIVSALIIYLYFSGTDSWLYRTVLNKLFSEDGSINLMGSTGKSRIVSMIADIQVFLHNPFGNGTQYYESVWRSYLIEGLPDSSSPVGMTSSLAVYGIFPVFAIWFFYIRNKWVNRNNFSDWLVCILLIINTTLAQPQIFFPCFIVMVMVSREYREVEQKRG